MIKTFYRKQSQERTFFRAEMKIRSMAYGKGIHDELSKWLEQTTTAWNDPKEPFLLSEEGHFSGNPVCRCRTEFMKPGQSENAVLLKRRSKARQRLWFNRYLYEIGKEGELILNQTNTGVFLGSELKAWGATVLWEEKKPAFYLLVIGKPVGESDSRLSVYALQENGIPKRDPVAGVPMSNTLEAKSHLCCFGRHVFTVHDNRLDYFYFCPEQSGLENVAIESDTPNHEKECCQNVTSAVVADRNGRVYWQSGNRVYSFPVGFPRRIAYVDGGQQYTHLRIHTHQDSLFLYRVNRLNRDYECMECTFTESARGEEGIECRLFNRGSVRNVFYYEQNQETFYIKLQPNAYKASLICRRDGAEQLRSSFVTEGIEEIFCDDGFLYVGTCFARGS